MYLIIMDNRNLTRILNLQLNGQLFRQTIQGRVFNKSPILKWRKEKGQLFFIQMHIKSAEVKCVAFNDECDKFYDKIEVCTLCCYVRLKLAIIV